MRISGTYLLAGRHPEFQAGFIELSQIIEHDACLGKILHPVVRGGTEPDPGQIQCMMLEFLQSCLRVLDALQHIRTGHGKRNRIHQRVPTHGLTIVRKPVEDPPSGRLHLEAGHVDATEAVQRMCQGNGQKFRHSQSGGIQNSLPGTSDCFQAIQHRGIKDVCQMDPPLMKRR